MLYTADGGAYAPEYEDLARRIVLGDGLGWSGDPDLELRIGVVTERATGKTMRRLEVWRHCEDGGVRPLAHWHPSEAGQVCHDLAKMRAAVGGRTDSVLDRIDRENDRLEEAARAVQRDHMAQWLEHRAYQLVRMQGHAKTSFAVPGRKGA